MKITNTIKSGFNFISHYGWLIVLIAVILVYFDSKSRIKSVSNSIDSPFGYSLLGDSISDRLSDIESKLDAIESNIYNTSNNNQRTQQKPFKIDWDDYKKYRDEKKSE